VSHPCSELRLQTALSTPVEALTGERVEALHASALALPPLAAGPEQYHLAPPELDGDGLNLRWAGLGGVLEGEPSIGAPWQPVPGAVGGAVTVPVTNAPMMLFRVRAQ
jgi:hypothetical protein